jgi:transposase
MQSVTLVGIDLGKHSFHLRGQDQLGRAVFRKKVSRKQLVEFFATFRACTVVMEAFYEKEIVKAVPDLRSCRKSVVHCL